MCEPPAGTGGVGFCGIWLLNTAKQPTDVSARELARGAAHTPPSIKKSTPMRRERVGAVEFRKETS